MAAKLSAWVTSIPANKDALAPNVALGPLMVKFKELVPNSGATKFLAKTLNLRTLVKLVGITFARVPDKAPLTPAIVVNGFTKT